MLPFLSQSEKNVTIVTELLDKLIMLIVRVDVPINLPFG